MKIYVKAAVTLSDDQVTLNGEPVAIQQEEGKSWLANIYYSLGVQYPKFFKMDNLCKAGFLASEMLMGKLGSVPEEPKRDWSVILMSHSGSLDDDTAYQETIQSSDNYFPSPAVFVYTLSNIVTGEIAIRHKLMGESSCFITEKYDVQTAYELAQNGFLPEKGITHMIFGWCEYMDGHTDVRMFVLTTDATDAIGEWKGA